MKLELYYAPKTCALVPYVTLTEAGADFRVHNMNSRSGALKTPEYLRLNPKHKVPVLVIDGEPLTENVAIQIFINRTFPQAKLLPQDPHQEIKAISLMAWFASTIHPHLTPNARPENYCDLPGSADAVKRAGSFDTDKIIKELEKTRHEGIAGEISFDEQHDLQTGKGKYNLLFVQWQEKGERAVIYPKELRNGNFIRPPWMKQ